MTGGVEDDFFSLRDMILMILRHRRSIAIFVPVVTLLAAGYCFFGPQSYQAEGYLQVIPPPPSIQGVVDKEFFDTLVVSHLQKVKSAFIAKHVAAALSDKGYSVKALDLQKKVEISRPPKSNVIRVEASARSPEAALLMVNTWITYYLNTILENNIIVALSQVRTLLQEAQIEMMEKRGSVEQLKSQAEQTAPVITLSRSVDDHQIWKELAESNGPSSLKKLSGIQIKNEEQGEGYIKLQEVRWLADQEMGSLQGKCNFLKDVERILKAKSGGKPMETTEPVASSESSENARLYAEMLLKSIDIFQFGEPALMSSAKGAFFKIGLAFACSLAFACFCAFSVEWLRGAEI